MSETHYIKGYDCILGICKWLALQISLYYLMPYIWNYEYATGTMVLMCLYTSLYTLYWNFVDKERRFRWIHLPYLLYLVISIILYIIIDGWTHSVWSGIILPLYGMLCFLFAKHIRRFVKRFRRKTRYGRTIIYTAIAILLLVLKSLSVLWVCKEHGSAVSEKDDIIERRNYLVDKLVASPQDVLDGMPSAIGEQFQGEWALYSCSMLSAALVNISNLYPETKEENISNIDSLISIVLSPEIRHYDTMRWGEDPLTSLDGDCSHASYLSHLAWMICGYREISGDRKYDELLTALCETMNRRILESESMNLPTYPGEPIYVPDMLVAIVALDQYADIHNGKYRSTVNRWIAKAHKEWLDKETGLLVSFMDEDGSLYKGFPVKGSYSALNTYYLTFIDDTFALGQYRQLKALFWKEGVISGLKEYWDRTCYIGMDIDAGPILFELSPSGTAFFSGSATFFEDASTRNKILRTAETAGHTIKLGKNRHYLLANIALVGEAIMLAMRTHVRR